MANEVERIKQMATKDLLIDAVELPANHKKKTELAQDLEEVLSNFDDDLNYAHFVVRVRRTNKAILVAERAPEESKANDEFSIQNLVNETLTYQQNMESTRETNDSNDSADELTSDNTVNVAPIPQTSANVDETAEKLAPHELLENAKILEDNKDYRLARTIYRSLIKEGSFVSVSLVGIARCLEAEEKFGEAIRYYEEAIAYASDISTYQALSALLIKTGRDAQACEVLNRALTLGALNDVQKFDFHKSLGNCYTRLADHSKAESHYWQAYELNSDSDTLQVNVGTLALQKNDYDAATKHFERALDLNMKNDKAISGLGMIALMKGSLQAANDQFVRALSINPDNLGAIFNLVKTAYELKKFNDAAYFLRNYLSNHEPNVNILYSYTGILYHQEEYALAQNEVKKILELNPNHSGAKELAELIQSKLHS